MRPTQQEFANPDQWLLRLAAEDEGYRKLVSDSGGAARAAYRLARARCSVAGSGEPQLEDLQSAAALLAVRLGSGGALPIQSLLPGAPSSLPPAPTSVPLPARSVQPPARSLPPPATSAPPPAPSNRRSAPKSRPHSSRVSV